MVTGANQPPSTPLLRQRGAFWLLAALGACFVAYVARLHEITHDVFHEMAVARQFWQQGVSEQDPFAFTPTVTPVVHHEWGTGLALYLATVSSGLGVWGLTLLRWGLIAAMWWALYRVARLRGAAPELFALCALLVFPVFWVGFSTLRAQLFTLTCLAFQLWWQELDWRGRRWWIVPWWGMLVVWLNLHGGFVVGLGLMAIHLLERVGVAIRRGDPCSSLWHLACVPAFALAALPLNPYGWSYLPYLVRALAMPRPTIAEWRPLWETYAPLVTMSAFALACGLALAAGWQQRFRRGIGWASLGIAAGLALRHLRHGSIFALLWISEVPAWVSQSKIGRELVHAMRRRETSWLPVCQVVFCAAFSFAAVHQCWRPTLPGTCQFSSVCYPTEAVEYLRQAQFRGNLWTPFHAGAYVSWLLYPDVRISLDGRYEVAFAAGVMEAHERVFGAVEGWRAELAAYPVDAILVPTDSPLCEALAMSAESQDVRLPNWSRVYADQSYQVWADPDLQLPRIERSEVVPCDAATEAFRVAGSDQPAVGSDTPSSAGVSSTFDQPEGWRFFESFAHQACSVLASNRYQWLLKSSWYSSQNVTGCL